MPADLDDEQRAFQDMKLTCMATMAEIGVTAEEYAAFLTDDGLRARLSAKLRDMAERYNTFDDENVFDDLGEDELEEVTGIADADMKSLRIKVQLKDVSKPPMWREIVIPADFNFSQLHHCIQAVSGLCDYHLWDFQHKAYDHGMQIAIPDYQDSPFGMSGFYDADVTPVTGFLAKKGDKLEYVYDYGDDWIFVVTVLEVMDRQGEVAECTKWKCDFQPIEDTGGVWSYLDFRSAITDAGKLTAKQKKEFAKQHGYDSFDEIKNMVVDHMFDPEFVNDCLAEIPDTGRTHD